jgi:MerR family transcriptional regulator, light-induced transcriptional regulator
MGQMLGALGPQALDRQVLRGFEKYFIAPEIQERYDVRVRQVDLARIISNEIVPRLLHLHTEVMAEAPPVDVLIDALRPRSTDIDALAHIVLGDDIEAAATYITVMRERGLSMETLYVELLEPTARHLGKMWDNDECDFIDVTIGVARLQSLLAIFNETYILPELSTQRHILLATTPGNQHSFGIAMIERLLLAAGWQVQTELAGSEADIIDSVEFNWFAVVGLTAGSDHQLAGLQSVITHIRTRSRNAGIGILVGGPMFIDNPHLAKELGADATAENAPTAVLAAQKLFDLALRTNPSFA